VDGEQGRKKRKQIMVDALVIGDGTAGIAAAITLAKEGRRVTVVQREIILYPMRAGESLSSSALISLKELDVLDAFLLSGHLPCHGNSSSWGNNQLHYFDFIQSPMGQGWYINRPKFNQMLLAKAAELDVTFITCGRAPALNKNANGTWVYNTGDNNTRVTTRTVIDASGRNSWLSRHLGIKRIEEDKQIAVIGLVETGQNIKILHSLVEAVKDGWWYVAEAGSNKVVCAFFTDPGLHHRDELSDPAYLNLKKEETVFVKYRVPGYPYKSNIPPQLTAAGSSYLSQFSGPGWLAAGDAACAMDPLSSHGIAFALRSGIDAGRAVSNTLNGEQPAFAQYDETLRSAIKIYREKRTGIYRQETRWPDYPYWQKRQKLNVFEGV
jgi:flavin-dependent dehydrogenase